jgi:hypothetical protein
VRPSPRTLGAAVLAVLCVGIPWKQTSLARASTSAQDPVQDRTKLVLAHDNTNFPLTGRHKTVECGACHVKGILGGSPLNCEVCHWSRRQDDPYRLQLGAQCGDCHTPQNWARLLPGAWEHERVTGFRLEGRHSALDCADCHDSREFRSTVAACVQCHLGDFQATTSPDHQEAHFPADREPGVLFLPPQRKRVRQPGSFHFAGSEFRSGRVRPTHGCRRLMIFERAWHLHRAP